MFCGLQVWLDKLTELLWHIYRLRGQVSDVGCAPFPQVTHPADSTHASLPPNAPVPGHKDLETENASSSSVSPSGTDFLPNLSECYGSEWLKFRDQGIVTLGILTKFPKYYVEGLFTPAELLKLLTAFMIAAPISPGSSEYVMPCLLLELASHELDKHRQLDPSSPAAPLLIQFPDKWVPAGVFIILTVYLQKVAGWRLRLSSQKARCLHRNCVEFHLPTGHGGSVTLVDSFEYLEVHVLEASTLACQRACPRIARDILRGVGEVCDRLHYGTPQLKIAFFCHTPSSACSQVPHLAEVVDDELVCSLSGRRSGELGSRDRVWLKLIPSGAAQGI